MAGLGCMLGALCCLPSVVSFGVQGRQAAAARLACRLQERWGQRAHQLVPGGWLPGRARWAQQAAHCSPRQGAHLLVLGRGRLEAHAGHSGQPGQVLQHGRLDALELGARVGVLHVGRADAQLVRVHVVVVLRQRGLGQPALQALLDAGLSKFPSASLGSLC